MRYCLAALCLTLPAAVSAAEAAEAAAEQPSWLPVLLSVITAVIGWVATMLRKKFKVDAEKAQLDASKSLMEQKNFIIDNRIIPFAVSTAEHWLALSLPKLIVDATDGDGFKWKEHWADLVTYLKARVVKKFLAENVDIIKLLGEDELDNLLDRLALKLIGKLPEKVQRFLPADVVDKLTDKASEFAVDKGRELLNRYI